MQTLDFEQRFYSFWGFIELWTALPLNLFLLHRMWKDRETTHALILSMSWLLLADLGMILNFGTFHMVEMMTDSFPSSSGIGCQTSGFISLIFVIFSNLASTMLAYVTYRTLGLGAKGFSMHFRPNFARNTVLLLLPGIIFAIVEKVLGQIGSYRDLYCAIADPGEWAAGFWLTLFLFVACAATQTYFYSRAYSYVEHHMNSSVDKGRVTTGPIGQDGEEETQKRFLQGMRDHAWRMSALFPLAWVPIMVLSFVSYVHGGVYTESGGASHPRWLDIVAVLTLKIVPVIDTFVVFRALANAARTNKHKNKVVRPQKKKHDSELPMGDNTTLESHMSPLKLLVNAGDMHLHIFGGKPGHNSTHNGWSDASDHKELTDRSAHSLEAELEIEFEPDQETGSQLRAALSPEMLALSPEPDTPSPKGPTSSGGLLRKRERESGGSGGNKMKRNSKNSGLDGNEPAGLEACPVEDEQQTEPSFKLPKRRHYGRTASAPTAVKPAAITTPAAHDKDNGSIDFAIVRSGTSIKQLPFFAGGGLTSTPGVSNRTLTGSWRPLPNLDSSQQSNAVETGTLLDPSQSRVTVETGTLSDPSQSRVLQTGISSTPSLHRRLETEELASPSSPMSHFRVLDALDANSNAQGSPNLHAVALRNAMRKNSENRSESSSPAKHRKSSSIFVVNP
eukprot:gb/GEZN01003561.1/.p1 GENE.gb/GEZN01003561.1/~~gb/GEZN01003561.1/.p1  ORF type:complete len:676 (-),score=63.50 gb/GEZN01003561.1/:6-2033(-)